VTCHKTFTDRKDEYSRNVAAFKNGGTAEVHHSDQKCASTNNSTCNHDQRSFFSHQQGPPDDSSHRQSSLHTNFTDVSDITVCFIYKNLSLQYICCSMILTKWCYLSKHFLLQGGSMISSSRTAVSDRLSFFCFVLLFFVLLTTNLGFIQRCFIILGFVSSGPSNCNQQRDKWKC